MYKAIINVIATIILFVLRNNGSDAANMRHNKGMIGVKNRNAGI